MMVLMKFVMIAILLMLISVFSKRIRKISLHNGAASEAVNSGAVQSATKDNSVETNIEKPPELMYQGATSPAIEACYRDHKNDSARARACIQAARMHPKANNIPSCKAYLAAYTDDSMQPPKVVDRKDALAVGALVVSAKAIPWAMWMFGKVVSGVGTLHAAGGLAATLQTGALLSIMSYAGAGHLLYKWVPCVVNEGRDRKGNLKRLAEQCQADHVAKSLASEACSERYKDDSDEYKACEKASFERIWKERLGEPGLEKTGK